MRAKLSRIFCYAVVLKLRNDDPADWKLLSHVLPQKAKIAPIKHLMAMDYQDCPALYRKPSGIDAAKQSVIVRTRGREAYLLVLNKPGFYRNDSVDIVERNLRPELTRVCVTRMDARICRRLEVIYQFEDKEQENEVVRFLRAND